MKLFLIFSAYFLCISAITQRLPQNNTLNLQDFRVNPRFLAYSPLKLSAFAENPKETRESLEKPVDFRRKSGKFSDFPQNFSPNRCDCGEFKRCMPCESEKAAKNQCFCETSQRKCPLCNVGKAVREIHEAAEREVW